MLVFQRCWRVLSLTRRCMCVHTCTCRVYTEWEELSADYASGALHPGDLKPALARHLNEILQVHGTHCPSVHAVV
jgi:hypothetical protein